MKNARPVLNAILCLMTLSALLLIQPARVFAQDKFDYEAERKRALQMIQAGKMPDATPILEKLREANPDDMVVLENLAYAISVVATTEKDPEKRKKAFLRARALAIRAKELGDTSQRNQLMIEQIPADGDMQTLTGSPNRTPAEDALLEGEAAFAKGEMERAIEHYERALTLNPKLYEAPLYIGDAYHKMGRNDKAYESYARAAAIDPDRDTAYRYWGNVLMRENKLKEAKEKLIEGVIAAPYTRATWQFLMNWAERSQIRLSHPRIEVPTSSVQQKDEKNISIVVNPGGKKDGADAWMIYSITRAAWMTEKRISEEFPQDKKYRHSLREEASALRLTAESVLSQLKEGKLKEDALDVSIANLLKLHRAGLTEAYILLAMPDEGIARDYVEYRKNNRDKLRQYMNEHVTAAK